MARAGKSPWGHILWDLICEVTEDGGTSKAEECQEGTCSLGTLMFCDAKKKGYKTSLVVSGSDRLQN